MSTAGGSRKALCVRGLSVVRLWGHGFTRKPGKKACQLRFPARVSQAGGDGRLERQPSGWPHAGTLAQRISPGGEGCAAQPFRAKGPADAMMMHVQVAACCMPGAALCARPALLRAAHST